MPCNENGKQSEGGIAINFRILSNIQLNRIYKVTDTSEVTCNFIPASVSDLIFNYSKKDQEKIGLKYPIQNEYGLGSPQSKNQRSIDNLMIKESCIKLNVDRMGNIKPFTNTQNFPPEPISYISSDNQDKEFQKSNLNDKESDYNNKIHFFHSFAEAEDFENRAIALQDPIQRLRDTVRLILRVYGFTRVQLNARIRDNTINFTLNG